MQTSLHENLRRPEAELFTHDQGVNNLLNEHSFDIRKPFPPYVVPFNPDWTADPYADKTWSLYFHSLYWLQAYDEAIIRNPDQTEKLLADLKEIVLSNVDLVLDQEDIWPQMLWDDHATSYRISHVSFLYAKYLKQRLSADEDARLSQYAAKHRDILKSYLDSDKWLLSNHTLFQLEGLIDLAASFTHGDEKKELFKFCADHFEAWFNRIVNIEQGSVKEHAAFYHAFLMARIRAFFDYASILMGDDADQLPDVASGLLKMSDFLWHMCVAAQRVPAIGDTKYQMRVDAKYTTEFTVPPYETPMSRYIMSNGTAGKASRGLTSYDQDGFYFIRNGEPDSELFTSFLDKPFIGPHGHSDGLSFETFYNGHSVLADSGGPFKYGNKLRFKYFQKPIGHNGVVIGDGQQVYHSNVHLSRSNAGITLLKGDAQVTKNIRWVRGLVQLHNNALVVIDFLDHRKQDVDAYVRFQLGHEFTPKEIAPSHYALTNEMGLQVEAKLLRTEFASAPHPDEMQQDAFCLEYEDESLSLHDYALLTHQDNRFLKSQILKSPITSESLHATVFSFGQSINCTTSSLEGTHTIEIDCETRGSKYQVTFTERVVDGITRGFGLSAEELM